MRELTLSKKLSKFGIKPGLERIAKLMVVLGHPEQKMKVVLVTGTNGKGSVTSYLASILKEAGYKTGSYFSPHLVNYNERFKINGEEISDAKLKKYEKIILDLFEKGKYEMTEFEALTAIAYKYFADEDCDFAVMEIGMGGRLDATNIADECIGIVTNVALEHTDYLGKTIKEIAFEKAGILKKGIGITGAENSTLNVIKSEIGKRNLQLRVLNEDFCVNITNSNCEHTNFNFVGHNFLNDLEIKLIGRYQAYNAALAVAAAEELGIETGSIRLGLKSAKNPGRLEVVSKKPIILLDAAHNPHGIKELTNSLSLFDYERLICVFGVMKDKNWKEMLRLLGPHCDTLIATQSKGDRTTDADEVAKEARLYTKAIAIHDIKKSFVYAKKQAKKTDLVLVCGSIYLLGEVLSFKSGENSKLSNEVMK